MDIKYPIMSIPVNPALEPSRLPNNRVMRDGDQELLTLGSRMT